MTATILKRGDIAIIGYNADDPSNADTISFVLLAPIGSGTQIFFTDRNWNGTAFPLAGGGDGTYTYTAGSDLAAGTIVTITTAQLNAAGINLADTGDTIYVFQGTDLNTPTTFLYAADIADGNNVFNGNLTNTNLSIAAGTAVAIAGDDGVYGDRGHNTQAADLLTMISSPTNWTSDNNSLELTPSGNLLSAPDQQVWSVLAGDAGLLRMSRDGVDTASQQLAIFQSLDDPINYFNHPNDIVFDTVHGLFFVADSDTGNRRILQGNIADLYNPGVAPTLKVIYTDQTAGTSHGQINGLAIDVEAANGIGNLYFVNQGNFEKITYAWNGNSTLNQTPSILATLPAGSFANEIALDIANHRAFVLSEASNTQAIPANPGDPGAQFDPDSGTYYVIGTAATNNELWQVTGLDRTDTSVGQTTFAKLVIPAGFVDPDGGSSAGDFNDLKGLLESIDIDPSGNFLYFTAAQLNNGVNGAVGGIYRYNLTNGTIDTLYTEGNATDYLFKYIDVDPISGKYFVSNNSFDDNTGANTSTIMVHGLSAGTPTLFGSTPISNSAVPWGLIVDNGPTLTGTGTAATYTETAGLNSGIGTRVITANGFTANDPDTAGQTDQLGGAQVRISTGFLSGASHQDTLSISGAASGTLASGISFSYNSADGVLTLTGANTFANYQAALALVQYSVSGDNPTNYGTDGSRIIAYSVTDGLMYSDEVFASVTVIGVDDNPINLYNGSSTVPSVPGFNEDTSKVFSTANNNALNVSDPDADPALQPLQVTLSVLHGTLTLASTVGLTFSGGSDGTADTTMTFTGTANAINAALGAGLTYAPIADYNGSDTLTFTTSDQGSTGTGGPLTDSDMIALTINPVVDIANDTLSFNEDSGTHTLAMPNNDTFENSNRAITAVTDGAHGTVTINNNGTPGDNTDDFLVYTQTADYNGADSFTYTVTSGGVTETATVTVNIAAVADIANDSQSTNEDTAVNVLVQGNDSFENSGHTITNVGTASHGTAVLNNNGTAGDPTDDYIVYTPNADYNGTDSFTYTVTSGGVTETATVSMTINAVADIVADSISVAEDSGANALNGIGNPVSLLANDSFESPGRFISAVTQGAHGTVTINDNGTAGDKTDDYVVYTVTDANYNGSDSFNYTVTSGGVTEIATVSVTITPVNDAPVNAVPVATQTLNEDGTKVFSTGNGNAVSVSDIDVGAGSLTVTLSVAHGTLTLSGTSGLTFTPGAGDGTDDASMTFSGTAANINAALQGLLYKPAANYNGTDTLSITTNDNGNTGTPGAQQDVDSVAISITAVNDAPVRGGTGTQTMPDIDEDPSVNNGQSVSAIASSIFTDPNDNPPNGLAGIAVHVNNLSANGQWEYSTNGGSSWTAIGAVALNNAMLLSATTLVRFNPAGDFNGPAPQLAFLLVDDSAGAITSGNHVDLSGVGAIGGTSRYSDEGAYLDQAVNAVNDAPINDKPGTQTIGEDATLTFSTGNGNRIAVSDVDVGAGNLTVTLSATHGTLTLSGTSGLMFTPGAGDGTDDASMTFSGTAANINAALQGLLYKPTGDYNGSDTLSITTNDNGNTGTPGAQQDADTVTINISAVADIVNDSVPATEDTPATLNLLANDSFENAGRAITAVTQGAHGTVTINDNSTPGDNTDDFVVYTPNADYNGPDSFSYTVTSGGVTETATVNVSVAAVADIANDTPTTNEDNAVNVLVLGNDSFEGTPAITNVGAPSHGTAVLNNNGTAGDTSDDFIVYTPNADYNGADSFSYTVTSGGVTETGTVNVTVNAGADIADDNVSVFQDSGSNNLNLLANDSFENSGRAITAVGAAGHGTTAIDNHGTPLDATDDFVTYTPNGGYSGSDSFTYTVTSGGVTETATVSVSVAPPDAQPVIDLDGSTVAVDTANSASYGEQAPPTILAPTLKISDADDSNIEGATVSITGFSAVNPAVEYLSVNGGTNGTLNGITFSYNAFTGVLSLTGSASLADYQALLQQVGYESTSDDPGTSRSISWVINDGTLASAAVTTSLTITPVDDAAVAKPDAVSTDEAHATTGNVFSNNGSGADSDPDGPALTVSAVNGSSANVGTQITLASGALLTLNANGTFSYDPNHAFDATPAPGSGASNTPAHDSFTYTLAGGGTATVSVTIAGLDSNDTLLGTPGADTFAGGAGNDSYFVDNAGDRIVESVGQGNDHVFASIGYILNSGAEVEQLSTTDANGTSAIYLDGNEFAQTLTGNAGNNYLDGGGGGDTLVGGLGNDAIIVNPGDIVVEAVGGGYDNVAAKASYILNAGAEIEVLSTSDNNGTAAISLNGNEFGQIVQGNAGNNYLDGGGGGDTLVGDGGNDTIIVNPGDIVVEAVGGGYDNVAAKASYILNAGAEIELLSTTDNSGTAAINLTGNEFGQIVQGNAGNNVLDGGLGNDVLVGLAGADTFAFTTALGANNVDKIYDFVSGTDKIALDDAIFTAIGSAGALNPNAFFAGTAAHDADDRIIYDQTTGNLYYDADGNGAGAAILFANLSNHAIITAADFTVI